MNQTTAASHLLTRPAAIVIRGLPGIGKTTLANEVIRLMRERGLKTFQVNADEVRATVNRGLGFTNEDRIENARRIGSISFLAASNGCVPVVDFVMPNKLTFDSFCEGIGATNFHLWSLRPNEDFRSRFEDTNKIFERLQDWWSCGVFKNLNELEPFDEAQLQSVARKIVNTYTETP